MFCLKTPRQIGVWRGDLHSRCRRGELCSPAHLHDERKIRTNDMSALKMNDSVVGRGLAPAVNKTIFYRVLFGCNLTFGS